MNSERKFLILGSQLVLARESIALDRQEVATRLGINIEELINWENGRSEPSIEQLWRLAKLYCRSTDYFLSPNPGPPDQLSFRLLQRRSIKDLGLEVRKVLIQFDELCRAEKELETLLEMPRKIGFKRLTEERDPEDLAQRERERLGLGQRPIKDLRSQLTQQGVRIFELPIPQEEFSGLAWWHQHYGPCILVNARDIKGRRTFTLAHEYAHLLIDDPPTVCGPKLDILDIAEDRFANEFAAAFLMPASDLEKTFNTSMWVETELGRLARRYGTSLQAVGRRLEKLGLLPKGVMSSLLEEWEKRGFPRAPRGPRWRRRLGEYYVNLALKAYLSGAISIGKLSYYLGIDVRKAFEAVEEE
jgi:Zn-dependent peptidase ImmA (M78 family)/DNA-binding XRE family transcriptional regulator